MRTPRQISLDRAVLNALSCVPEGYLLTDALLRAEASRMIVPPPTTFELDAAILHADRLRRMTGVTTDEGTKWQIAPVGRAWLAEHP